MKIDLDKLIENTNKDNSISKTVTKLKNDLENIELMIKEDESSSFQSIKNSLKNLNDKINDRIISELDIDSLIEERKSEIRNDYYSTIINSKNSLYIFNIDQIDSLIASLDNYINNSKNTINKSIDYVENTCKNVNLISKDYLDKLNILSNEIKLKYTEAFEYINNIVKDFKSYLENYSLSLNKIVDEYLEKIENINKLINYQLFINKELYPSLDELLCDGDNTKSILEKFKNNLIKEDYNKLLFILYLYRMKDDNYTVYLTLFKNELTKNEIIVKYNKEVDKVSLFNTLFEKITLINKEINLYLFDSKNRIKEIFYNLEKDVNILLLDYSISLQNEKVDITLHRIDDEKLVDFLTKDSEKQLFEIKYQIEKYNINKNFILKKNLIKLGYDLTKLEKEKDLTNPLTKLEKINDEYNILNESLSLLYRSEKDLLDKSKNRTEIMELSNIKFAQALIEHRNTVTLKMLESANEEYNIRIGILKELQENSTIYNKNMIDKYMNIYLNKIDDINKIKNIAVKIIENKVKINEDGYDEKVVRKELYNSIKKYDNLNNDIIKVMNDDYNILSHKEVMSKYNDLINIGNENALKIKDLELKKALAEVEKSNKEIDALLSSTETDPIDYKSIYDSYKEKYEINRNYLNDELNKRVSPLIDNIKDITNIYSVNLYKKSFEKIDLEHRKALKEKYIELNKQYDLIDDKYNSIELFNNKLIEEAKIDVSNKIEIIEAKKISTINDFNKKVDSLPLEYEKFLNSQNIKFSKQIIDGKSKLKKISSINNNLFKESIQLLNKTNKKLSLSVKKYKSIYKEFIKNNDED